MAEIDISIAPPENIIDILNDDCLQAILLKLKDLYDFYRAAKVCTRFQHNVKECFSFKKLRIANVFRPQRMKRNIVLFDDADTFLSIFGPKIKYIECDFRQRNSNHDNDINMITKYCGNTLVELHIEFGTFNNFRPQFQVLKKISFYNCLNYDFDPVVAFPELKNLHMD